MTLNDILTFAMYHPFLKIINIVNVCHMRSIERRIVNK